MGAYVTKDMRWKMAQAALHDRLDRAIKGDRREFVEVPFEWQTKQSRGLVWFPTYGCVPDTAIRWRKSDGTIVNWANGRQGDVFLLAPEYAHRR